MGRVKAKPTEAQQVLALHYELFALTEPCHLARRLRGVGGSC